MESPKTWHALSVEEVFRSLQATEHGLSQQEAEQRLARFGPNELQERGKVSPLAIFLEQFKSILIIILLAAVAVSAAIGEVLDATIIFAIVIACTVLGFVQEYRAGKAMEALRRMAAPTASVLRDGDEREVAARELVPGDVALIRTGDRIPGDSRLIEAVNLRVGEASLTGESVPVEKMISELGSILFMAVTIELTATTSPTDTPWTHIRGRFSLRGRWGTNPNLPPKLLRCFPVTSI